MNDPQEAAVNSPPTFTGKRNELEGFLARIELRFEANSARFNTDESQIRFMISYFLEKPLDWAACLKRNDNPIIHSFEDFLSEIRKNLEIIQVTALFPIGLHLEIREKLAFVNSNPVSFSRVITNVFIIENLIKKNNLSEYYYSGNKANDPMEIDLYRIKKELTDVKYFPSHKKLYIEDKKNYSEEKRMEFASSVKKLGHLKFNCPNRIKPKGTKGIKRIKADVVDNVEEKLGLREKKNGVCFLFKQLGHLKFNCPNRIKPKGTKGIKRIKADVVDNVEEKLGLRKIKSEGSGRKNNIIDFN
eukprot:jgi/Orpsp1_1/1181480/evm.model.c7180000077318.2